MRTVHWFPQTTHQLPGHTFHSKVKQNQTDISTETSHLSLPMSYNPRPSSSRLHQCPMTNFHLCLGHSTGPCLPSSYISWTSDFLVRKFFCLCTFRIGRPQGDPLSGEEGPYDECRSALRVAFTLAYMQGVGISLSKPWAVTAWTRRTLILGFNFLTSSESTENMSRCHSVKQLVQGVLWVTRGRYLPYIYLSVNCCLRAGQPQVSPQDRGDMDSGTHGAAVRGFLCDFSPQPGDWEGK